MSSDRKQETSYVESFPASVTNLRTVAASVGLNSPRRFYKDFRDLRLAIVAKNREIRKQRIHLIANTTQPLTFRLY